MVERYAKRDGYTVIATARDAKSMPKVETGPGARVIVVTMDQSKPKGCLEVRKFTLCPDGTDRKCQAVEEIKSHGITRVDIVSTIGRSHDMDRH